MSDAGVRFEVSSKPAPQGSKRPVGNGRMVEMSKSLPAWRTAVAFAGKAAWVNQEPMDCAVAVTVEFRLLRPKKSKFGEYPAGPPDLDKLQRSTGDALKAGGVISDDSRIIRWEASKVWGEPGATIHVRPIHQEAP